MTTTMSAAITAAQTKSRKGFASMDPKTVSKIAAMGGTAAHKLGKAHRFTSAEAKIAGAKGGKANREKKNKGA